MCVYLCVWHLSELSLFIGPCLCVPWRVTVEKMLREGSLQLCVSVYACGTCRSCPFLLDLVCGALACDP